MRNPLSAIPASLRGIVLMLIATLFFTGMQVLVRHVAEELHPFEVAFFRNFFGLVVLAPIAARPAFRRCGPSACTFTRRAACFRPPAC
jgi:drug/metabolite transporter (DMT)-like permease